MNRYTDFFRYANALGITDENRADMVYEHTNGRTSSLRELSDQELSTLTHCLSLKHELRIKSSRSVVLSIIQQMIGRCTTRCEWWQQVDRICSNPRIAGKPFRNLTIAELDQVAIKLRMITRKQKSQSHKQQPEIMCRLPIKYS